MEKEEASLPTLKVAAGNPEGRGLRQPPPRLALRLAGDAPVMTEAVGSLAWTSLQLAGSTIRLWARKKSIPRMAVETSASKKPQVKC